MAFTAYKEFWSEFFEIYHNLDCLWNTKHENYKNRQIRRLALSKLVTKLQEVEPEASEDTVKRKINTFRSNFYREVRKMRLSHNDQSKEIYNPTLWYFDHLSFLLHQEKYRKRHGVPIDCKYGEDMTMTGLVTAKDEFVIEDEEMHAELINQDDNPDDDENLQYGKIIKTENEVRLSDNSNRNNLAESLIEHTPVLQTNSTAVQESTTQPQNVFSAENYHLHSLENTTNKSTESEGTSSARKSSSNQKRLKLRLKSVQPHNKFKFKNIDQPSILTDEAAIYGQAWACGFRKLNPQQQIFAKKAIDDILILGQLQALNLSTVQVKANLFKEASDQGC